MAALSYVGKVPLSFLPYCKTMFHHIDLFVHDFKGVEPYLCAGRV